MFTIMKTKTFLNAIDDAYAKGISAGVMAQKVQDREDQNRRLEDMLQRGKQIGYEEALKDIRIEEIDLDGLVDDVGGVMV